MFKLWERQVFHNINDQIMNKLKNISPDQIESKLRMSGPSLLKLILKLKPQEINKQMNFCFFLLLLAPPSSSFLQTLSISSVGSY
jgi:hypothetical protein